MKNIENNNATILAELSKGFNTIMKDINDCIMNLDKDKFTFEELQPFFTNNFYDLIYF